MAVTIPVHTVFIEDGMYYVSLSSDQRNQFENVMSQQPPRTYFQNVDTLDEYGVHEGNNEEQQGNGTLSKQFQPKKFKDGNKMWNKDMEQDQAQTYSYTPFKASTMSRSQTTPKPTRDVVHTGTLRPPKGSPFVYDPPSAPTTPKMARARPGSAAGNPMSREQKLTWGRGAPPTHFRSASAMSHGHVMNRPNEFTPLSVHQPPMAMQMPMQQRYPSFSTLPHNDQMENMAPMQSPFYPPQMISRPSSAVPSMVHPSTGIPPMATNLASFVPPIMTQKPSPRAVQTQLAISSPHVNWNRISIICCMQVLFCLSIFGVGIARIMFGALWAVGLEIVFATSALLPALVGIYAVKQGSYCSALICFASNALEVLMATIPFTIGLFPLFPIIFPKIDEHWVVAENEPVHLDFILSFLIVVQALLSLHLAIMGCRVGGSFMTTVDEMKLQNNMRAAFEDGNGQFPMKTV